MISITFIIDFTKYPLLERTASCIFLIVVDVKRIIIKKKLYTFVIKRVYKGILNINNHRCLKFNNISTLYFGGYAYRQQKLLARVFFFFIHGKNPIYKILMI